MATGVVEVSLIVNVVVSTIVPAWLPVLKVMVAVSSPSVVASAVGNTENDPALLLIVMVPELVAKSAGVSPVVTCQYKVVPLATLVVATLTVPDEPSLICDGAERV